MERALYEYIIVGVKTNLIFHKAVLRNARFRTGDINTHFIKEENIAESVKEVASRTTRRACRWPQYWAPTPGRLLPYLPRSDPT